MLTLYSYSSSADRSWPVIVSPPSSAPTARTHSAPPSNKGIEPRSFFRPAEAACAVRRARSWRTTPAARTAGPSAPATSPGLRSGSTGAGPAREGRRPTPGPHAMRRAAPPTSPASCWRSRHRRSASRTAAPTHPARTRPRPASDRCPVPCAPGPRPGRSTAGPRTAPWDRAQARGLRTSARFLRDSTTHRDPPRAAAGRPDEARPAARRGAEHRQQPARRGRGPARR